MKARAYLLFAVLLLAGCAGRRAPLDDSELGAMAELANRAGRDQALHNLDLATEALRAGNAELAEQALRTAIGIMGVPRADGQWAAIIGRESNKEWKGEPWERMAAFLTLGHVLYAKGDKGNALAMYKSAVLADTGTSEDRFRSDLVAGWVLQGLVLQGDGEPDVAEDLFRKGADAVWSNATLDALTEALHDADPKRQTDGTTRAREALMAALPAGVAVYPRDAMLASQAARSRAVEMMQGQGGRSPHRRKTALQRFNRADFEAATAALPDLVEAWHAELGIRPVQPPELAASIEALGAERPNLVVIVDNGSGPSKSATGTYDEQLRIVPGRAGRAPKLALDGESHDLLLLDTATWQATTRGGRRVDGWLHGKALYRDTGLISGYFLIYLSQELAWQGDRRGSTLLAIAGAGLMASAALTIPEADTRAWDGIPEQWMLFTSRVESGAHALSIRGQTIQLDVPPRGQLVVYVPPDGPAVLHRP